VEAFSFKHRFDVSTSGLSI